MTDDTKVNLINLDEHLQYYQQGIEIVYGSISNVGAKLNKVN
jgi:prefoldin subunit 5